MQGFKSCSVHYNFFLTKINPALNATATIAIAVRVVGNSGIEAVGLGFSFDVAGTVGVVAGWVAGGGVGIGVWVLVFVNVMVLPSVVAVMEPYV